MQCSQTHSLCALQDEYANEPGTVIASDFYHSNELMPLSDEAIITRVVSNMGACEPAFLGARVSAFGKASVRCCGCGGVKLHTPCQQPSPGLWWVGVVGRCSIAVQGLHRPGQQLGSQG